MSAPRFRRPGMCAALMERKWQSTHSRRFAACLHRALERTPPWWFMYETTDVLSVRISTCRCSSSGWKSFRAKNTASSSKRFMCHRLWGSDHSPEAGMPSHTAPQPRLDASVVIHNARRYQAQGNSPAEEIWVAPRPQSFDAAAGNRDSQTARSPRCPRDSRFQP